jgi:hypothetical protein
LEPPISGSNDFVRVCAPLEGRGICFAVQFDEAVDCGLEIIDGSEDAMLQPAAGEFGEEALDSVQPRA